MISFIIVLEVFFYETTKAVTAIAQGISQEFKAAFNAAPVVTINHHVVTSESRPIAELATASKTISVDTTYVSTWLHSTKSISVRGDFVAKAGFDLNQFFKINVQTRPKLVTVMLPSPRILSLEMTTNEILDEKGGVINWLYPQDHAAALNQLAGEARLDIAKSSIMDAAKTEMEKRIRAIGALKDVTVRIQYGSGPFVPEKARD